MSISQFTAKDYEVINKDYQALMEAARKRCQRPVELEVIDKAFEFANEAHKNVRRRSGEPYMLHPIAVAQIVVSDIGLGYKSIAAALLHDVVEDTEYTVEDLRNVFGDKIASLVDGLTKIKTVLDNEDRNKTSEYASKSLQAENFKRILLTLNDDVRVVLIKLADRLHNCRTIEFMPEHKRDKILSETMYIFIPLAHRLGLYTIKSEMENIWLRYKEPADYEAISSKIDANVAEKIQLIDDFIEPIEKSLKAEGYTFEIKKRIKTPYSIWHKMKTKDVSFEQIFDLYAVRIIFEPKTDDPHDERKRCYDIFTTITGLYKYQPDRLRDWIKQPKSNGYEALHCTLMSHAGIWVEVQIRSRRMDDIAEKGIAAHWNYKRSGYISENDSEMDKWLAKVKGILQSPDVSALELLDLIHKDLVSTEIVVFTPKGDQKTIQNGSTALDFAYVIHTHIGNSAIAAKVNMKLVPLSHVLKSGDQVEIITADSAVPHIEWLQFLQTRHARRLVMDYFRDNKPEDLLLGAKILADSHKGVRKEERIVLNHGCKYVISECCHPIPGDPVIGFKRPDGTIEVHKKTCSVAEGWAAKHGELVVVPHWENEAERDFDVRISLSGIDRVGLLNDLTQKISLNMGINMRKLNLSVDDGIFNGSIEVLVHDRETMDRMIESLGQVEGIQTVIRTELR